MIWWTISQEFLTVWHMCRIGCVWELGIDLNGHLDRKQWWWTIVLCSCYHPQKNNGTTNVHKYCKCSSRKKRTKGSNGHMLTKRANSAKRADIFISMVGSKKSGLFGGNHGHKTAQHRAQFCAQFGANERNFKEYPSWVWPAIPANIQTTRTFVQNVLKFSRSAEISQMRTFPHFQTHRKLCSCDVRGVYIYLSLSAYHIISH